MAEVLLSGKKLTLVEFSVDAAKIEGGGWGCPYGHRLVKTDCEFVDTEQKKHITIAWVNISRHEERWIPQFRGLFIKLDERPPLAMEYNVPTAMLPLPDPIVAPPICSGYEGSRYDPATLDYSRIR